MHISHSHRADRLSWMHHYRRFLPHADLDLILTFNTSALSTSSKKPLQLQQDVDILRVIRADGFYTWKPMAVAPHLEEFRAAVRDGSVLNLYHMSSRSRLISNFEDSLRYFWSIPLSTTFLFHPPLTATQPSPAPEISDSDVFLVALHGFAVVSLFADYFPFPSEHHIDSDAINHAAHDNLAPPQVVNMHEGDVLYVPRGTGVDIRTTNSLALFIRFEIHTCQRQLADGLLHAVNITTRSAKLLEDHATFLPNDTKERSGPKWNSIISTAVMVAAEFTPPMRRFLPVKGMLDNKFRQIGSITGTQLVKDMLERFSHAAKSTLFDPVVEILASGDEGVRGIASDAVIEWAKTFRKQSHEQQDGARNTFLMCIEQVLRTTNATNLLNEMFSIWKRGEQSDRRRKQLKYRDWNLDRHNQQKLVEGVCAQGVTIK